MKRKYYTFVPMLTASNVASRRRSQGTEYLIRHLYNFLFAATNELQIGLCLSRTLRAWQISIARRRTNDIRKAPDRTQRSQTDCIVVVVAAAAAAGWCGCYSTGAERLTASLRLVIIGRDTCRHASETDPRNCEIDSTPPRATLRRREKAPL